MSALAMTQSQRSSRKRRRLHVEAATQMLRRTRLAAVGLFVCAWVCVGTQLADLSHFLLVSHSVCADHGELSHGAVRVAAPELRSGSTSPEVLALSGEDETRHDHCVPSADRGAVLQLTEALLVIELPEPCLVLPLPPGDVECSGRQLFRVAPKQSPPV